MPMAYTNPIDLGDGRFQFSDDAGQPVILPGTPSVLAQVAQMKAAPPPPVQLSPDVAAAAAPMGGQTANLDSAISGALAQGRSPSSPDAFGPISSGVAPPPQSAAQAMGGDQAKIAAALGAGGGTNPFDQKQTDPRILQAQASATPPKPQQLIFAGGGAQQAQAPQQSQGRVIPGGFQPHSRSAQMQAPIPEEDLTDIKRGITGQMTANDAMGRTQAETANETAGEYQSQAAGLGQIQNDNASREAVRQQRMDDAQAKFDQMNHALQSQHIDPAKAFRDESDADKFFTSLLVGLSTYGAGISHGDNTGLKLFRSRIDDSIAAQNKDLETQRAGVENQRGLVGMMREQFGDQRQADAAARMAYLDMGKQKLAEIAARGLGTEGKMKLDAANAALQTDWAKEKAKFDQATAGVISQSDVYRPAQVVGGPEAPRYAKNDGSYVDVSQEGEGLSLKASSPEMANQWRQQFDAIDETKSNIDQLREEIAKGPSAVNVKRVAMLKNNIATSIGGGKMGTSRMTGQGEMENIGRILETGEHVTSDLLGRMDGALDALESSMDGAKRRIINAAPRYSGEIETPKGDIVRRRLPNAAPQREIKPKAVE